MGKKPWAKKKKKLQPQQARNSSQKEDVVRLKELVEYLHTWRFRKDHWKFQKVKQIKLIKGMFDPKKVPDRIFPIFVDYMAEALGNAKTLVIERANEAIKETENWINLTEEEQSSTPKPSKVKYNRARLLLQRL